VTEHDPPKVDAEAPPTQDPTRPSLRRAPSLLVVNTGNGKGKSSAAFGVMLRALARGWKVAVVQFIKSGDWKVGEEKMGRELGVEWISVGDGFTWDSTISTTTRISPGPVGSRRPRSSSAVSTSS
jgi:ATP:corrinoid adenosyltransferase